MAFSVLLDACVLVPSRLRDVILELASQGAFRPVCSDIIEDELVRAIARIREKKGFEPDVIQAANKRLLTQMDTAFPDACVMLGSAETLTKLKYSPDPNDNHVVVAALLGRADQIVTFNLKDFPDDHLPMDINAKGPDEFLLDLFGLNPNATFRALDTIAARTGRKGPRLEVAHILNQLEASVPQFESAVRHAY